MDLYEHLGVPRSATAEEIKKAYKQKVREHHPDAYASQDEKDKHAVILKQVVEAFEVLGDVHKKSRYDVQGTWGNVRRPPSPSPKPKTAKTKEEFEKEKQEKKRKESVQGVGKYQIEPNLNCTFFGGGSTGRSILVQVKLQPHEFKNGCSKSVFIKKRDFCNLCGGQGDGEFPCPKCQNNKFAKQVCGHCHTRGVMEGSCPRCSGTGLGLWMVEEIHYKISPNTQPGHTVTVLGRGEEASGKLPGNVRIVVI